MTVSDESNELYNNGLLDTKLGSSTNKRKHNGKMSKENLNSFIMNYKTIKPYNVSIEKCCKSV